MSAGLEQTAPATANDAVEMTDGFHLVIDALKANDIDTIFGLIGIPITDLARLAQAQGMRFISFRHEQHAGNAAAIAGYMTQKPGICLTVSAPGFLNGLTALANATTNCFPMILISGICGSSASYPSAITKTLIFARVILKPTSLQAEIIAARIDPA